jgi:hypothetical protein
MGAKFDTQTPPRDSFSPSVYYIDPHFADINCKEQIIQKLIHIWWTLWRHSSRVKSETKVLQSKCHTVKFIDRRSVNTLNPHSRVVLLLDPKLSVAMIRWLITITSSIMINIHKNYVIYACDVCVHYYFLKLRKARAVLKNNKIFNTRAAIA